MAKGKLDSALKRGEPARLIPVVADSKREERVTSVVLATFAIVPAFAQALMEHVGVKIGTRSKIRCFTEVVLDTKGDASACRPDGLIVIETPKSEWRCIVEAKVGNANLTKEQVEAYLDTARSANVDAVLTVSNDFALSPTHHPVAVSKQKTRSVDLYHFSWTSLLTKAILLCETKAVDDPEQAYLLSELVRYLRHGASGVSAFNRMGKEWGEICSALQKGVTLTAGSSDVQGAVASWNELCRYLALDLTTQINAPVHVHMTKSEEADPEKLAQAGRKELVDKAALTGELVIPNAASRMAIRADVLRRTLNLSMTLKAPKDRKRPKAVINWLLRQLDSDVRSADDIVIRVQWPRRTPDTVAPLKEALANPECLVAPNAKELPSSFEVTEVKDLAGRFRGAKTFVEDALLVTSEFYRNVGQHLKPWVPKPPKMKEKKSQGTDGEEPPPLSKEPSGTGGEQVRTSLYEGLVGRLK